MDLGILHDELINDPLTRGYAGMTDEEAANDINTIYRSIQKTTLTGAEIYEQTDIPEFQGLAASEQAWVRDIWGLGGDIKVDAGSKARAVYLTVFGGGSATITNLLAELTIAVSRARELGLPSVTPGDVTAAKAWEG